MIRESYKDFRWLPSPYPVNNDASIRKKDIKNSFVSYKRSHIKFKLEKSIVIITCETLKGRVYGLSTWYPWQK